MYHPNREGFLLIGDPESKPAYLIISRCKKVEFKARAISGQQTPDDLVAMRMKFIVPGSAFSPRMRISRTVR
ncbi:hypothetical protein [Leptolinea tardivitalis]|uniref:Uncharacterized protein n=1 Tax=Leptolinea tardivitalis TaxID=229920 RepID=A0A0P6XEU3_9CHLR|nr:hypothetical protein [Leptolinea tardivitalis]KPL73697.1 hypothetical protein ADM99_02415 [Leptolinea tardivitalis]